MPSDNLGTEIVRFANQYQCALAGLANIFETLKTSDAHVLKTTLIESGLLERGLARERRAAAELHNGGAATTSSADGGAVVSVEQEQQSAGGGSVSRLQTAVELLLGTNDGGGVYPHINIGNTNNNGNGPLSTASPSSSSAPLAMMTIDQRSIVQLKLQILFEDLGKAVGRLRGAIEGDDEDDFGNANANGFGVNEEEEDSDEEEPLDADEDDDYQILRHHIYPSSSSGGVTDDDARPTNGEITRKRGIEAAVASATAGYNTTTAPTAKRKGKEGGNKNNTALTSRGAFKSLQRLSLLPSAVGDLRVLCEDLHERLFAANGRLRVSEAQREELLFRLSAREETLRGLRSHFLRELVGTVGNVVANRTVVAASAASGGGAAANTSFASANNNALVSSPSGGSSHYGGAASSPSSPAGAGGGVPTNSSSTTAAAVASILGNNPARFAGIPITFIEEADIEVARRIATAQLELDTIRSDHGKELWRQREGWARRLEAKEKEIIQMQIMFRNALASLQGKHASTVSRIVDENASLKQSNVQVEHLALQRAEAFFELKLNEQIAQLSAQYEGRLSLLRDQLDAANGAFRQSLAELKGERRAKRRAEDALLDAERAFDHAMLVEMPAESERAAAGASAAVAGLERENAQFAARIAALEADAADAEGRHAAALGSLQSALDDAKGTLKALEIKISDLQHDNAMLRSRNAHNKAEIEEKDATIRTLTNEVAAYREKFLTLQSPTAYLNQNFKFGDGDGTDDDIDDDGPLTAEERKKRRALLADALRRAALAEDALLSAEAAKKSLSDENAKLKEALRAAEDENEGEKKKSSGTTSRRASDNEKEKDAAIIKSLRQEAALAADRLAAAKDESAQLRSHIDTLNAFIAQLEGELEAERQLREQQGGGRTSASGNTQNNDGEEDDELLRLREGSPERPLSVSSHAGGRLTATPNDGGAGGGPPPAPMSRIGSSALLGASGRRLRLPPVLTMSVGCDTSLLFGGDGEMGREEWEALAAAFSSGAISKAGGLLEILKNLQKKKNTQNEDQTQAQQQRALILLPERTRNAELRARLADLNAQIRIACGRQEWPIGSGSGRGKRSDGEGRDGELAANDFSREATVAAIEEIIGSADFSSTTNEPSKEEQPSSGKKEKGEAAAKKPTPPSSRRGSGKAATTPTSAPLSSSQRHTAAATNTKDPTTSSADTPAPINGDPSTTTLLELTPVPITDTSEEITAQNRLFEREVARRIGLLADASKRLLLELSARDEEAAAAWHEHLLLLQQSGKELPPNAFIGGSALPPRGGGGRPQSASVRYGINAMPLPSSRLSNRSSRPGSASGGGVQQQQPFNSNNGQHNSSKFGAGFVISHRPQSGSLHLQHGGAGGRPLSSTPSSTRKGKAPALEPYADEDGVYEDDNDDDDYDESEGGQHRRASRVEAHFLGDGGEMGAANEDDDSALYYDSDGNPRYVTGFLPRRFQQSEDEAHSHRRASGGPTKGRMVPAAALAPRAPSVLSSSSRPTSAGHFGLGVGGGRWASLMQQNQSYFTTASTAASNNGGAPRRPQSVAARRGGGLDRKYTSKEEDGDEDEKARREDALLEYDTNNAASRHEATHRYIQPSSFFNVRNRIGGGGNGGGNGGGSDAPPPHTMQRWEMSSAQIRRAASRGLVRGGEHTVMAPSPRRASASGSGPDSPRYRPLPGETAEDQQQPPNPQKAAVNYAVTSLSRPVTAGPVRPPTVLEVNRAVGSYTPRPV